MTLINENCPKCNSFDVTFLGELGNTIWVRCRCCGWDFSVSEVNDNFNDNDNDNEDDFSF